MKSTQWTAKLASLADEQSPGPDRAPLNRTISDIQCGRPPTEQSIGVSLRLEGPYFSPADPHRYNTVVCMVAGTGISGALAIAAAFNHTARREREAKMDEKSTISRRWLKCVIIWSVRVDDDIPLPFLEPMSEGLELRRFLTGEGRKRVDLEEELGGSAEGGGRTWVYISGPDSFISAGKEACKNVKKKADVDYYAASWSI